MVRASDIILILVALLFPPISAAMITGCSCDLLINVVSTPRMYVHDRNRILTGGIKCLTILVSCRFHGLEIEAKADNTGFLAVR